MKKRIISFLTALSMTLMLFTSMPISVFAADGDIAINETNFPDEAFRNYVKGFDKDNNNILSTAEVSAIIAINTNGMGNVNNLKGIEFFTELKSLQCYGNNLTSLDVSKNTNLTSLSCDENDLTSLDVSQNTKLTMLNCSGNSLTSLDVSKNTALKIFSCENNKYTASSCVLESKDLPGNFDLSKASGWNNAEVTNDNKIRSIAGGDATYTYNCGNEKTKTFTIAFENHNLENGACTICGKCTHANTTAKPYDDGSNHHCVICSTCGKETVVDEICTLADTWATDAENHWKVCTKCNTEIVRTREEHNTTNSYGKDDAQHWAKCSVCGWEDTSNKADHVITYEKTTGKHTPKCDTCGWTGSQVDCVYNQENGTKCVCGNAKSASPKYTVSPNKATMEVGTDNGQLFALESYTGEEKIVWEIDQNYADIDTSKCSKTQCKVVGKKAGGPITLTAKSQSGEIYGTATITFTDDTGHTHSFTNYVSNNDATCTANGTKTAKCDNCDETDTITDDNSAKGHSFTNYVSNNDATCTANGTKTAKCDNCDETDTIADDNSAKGHSYVDGECTRCHETDPNYNPPHTHTLTAHAAAAATCTTGGNEAYWTCSGCNKIFSDANGSNEISAVPATPSLGHDYQDAENTGKEPTCTEAGKAPDRKCSRCDAVMDGAVISALGHSYVDGVCARCGETEQKPSPEYTVTPATAEIKVGMDNGLVFTLEGYTEEWQIDWEIDQTYAAIFTYGYPKNQCRIVGINAGGPITLTAKSQFGDEVYGTATITVTDDTVHIHTLTAHNAVPAACTTDGNEAYWTCSGCNKIFSDANGSAEITAVPATPALGHSYADGVCTRCGDVQSQTHTHTGGTVTCTQRAFCAVCGQEYGELAPHSFVNGVCAVCGAADTGYVPPHIHAYGTEWKHSDTTHWHECACGEKADEAYHVSDSGTVTKQPTQYETGTRTYYCAVCGGYISSETIPATGWDSYPSAPYIPPAGTGTSANDPYIQGDSGKSGWSVISSNIGRTSEGGTVEVNMNKNTKLPKKILSKMEGRDVDVVLDMGSYSWTINGTSVTKANEVDMRAVKIDKIPYKTVKDHFGDVKTVQLDLNHDGDFGFTAELKVYLGSGYNGMYANSYCYQSGSFEPEDSSRIIDGYARLRFTHASSWVIAIDDFAAMEDVSSAAAAHSPGTPIDMSASAGSGLTLPEFDEKRGFKLSNKKRRYRILKRRRLYDVLFVL